ncbi:MAG TPA: N-acetylmuramidase family protein [Azospirillaceae bacterium]|nr:N-acetylmuramidase family protein [Azospirillaceae bacterium]
MPPLPFQGAATKLADADIARAAAALGCAPAAVRAVLKVETGGKGGFLPDGRPRILFEAHLFSRATGGRYDAGHPAISAPSWNRKLYAGGAGEYDRLAAAVALDRTAALASASWGLFQILGSNFRECGHADVEAFVAAMVSGEGAQLDAFVNYVRRRKLDDELREGRWADFARAYNGPAYAANQYDTKLAAAFAAAQPETALA